MKKTLSIFSAASLLLFAACSQNELELSIPSSSEGVTEFTVETESATKVVFGSDLSVTWAAHDSIAIFGSGKGAKFYADAAGASSVFTIAGGEALADTSAYFAAYPATGWSIADNVLSGTIPGYQVAVPGSINPEYLLMAARSADKSLAMKNLVALLKITLSDDNISSVNIVAKGGAKIAGKVSVTLPESGDPVIEASTSSVMLVPERDADGALKPAFESGDYYIAVAPAAISAGIEVVITHTEDDKLGIKSSSSACTLYRSEVMYLDDLCSKVDWIPTVKTGLTFWDSNFKNPFASPTIAYHNSFSYTDESKFLPTELRNIVVTAVADDANGGHTYKMFAQKGYWNNSKQGFRGFPDKGDYIEFPAFPGLSLKAVKWTIGGVGTNNYPGLATASGAFVAGGEPYDVSFAQGDVVLWTNLEPAENTAYRITPDAFGNAISCRKFELLYIGTPAPMVVNAKYEKATDITGTSATFNGSFLPFGSSDIAADFECGFEYKTGSADWTSVNAKAVATTFSADVTGLVSGGEYTVRAWAKTKGGEMVYGEEVVFMSVSTVEKTYVFADGTSKYQVFSKSVSTSSSSLTAIGTRFDVTDKTDSSLEFSLFATGGLYLNTTQGLRYTGAVAGDYMILPAISGKKLKKVAISFSSTSYTAVLDIKSVTDLTVPSFGTTLVSSSGTVNQVMDLPSATVAAGTRYALVVSDMKGHSQLRIMNLTLTYE